MLGCFDSDATPFPTLAGLDLDKAYHFIDDVLLAEFPTAGPAVTTSCAAPTTLGIGCELPTSSNAHYLWTLPNNTTLDLTTFPYQLPPTAASGTYTLVIRVPHPDQTYDPANPATYYQGAATTALVTATASAPTVTITPSGPLTYCVGNAPITLQAVGATTYQWNTGATTATISVPSLVGTYTYTVTGTNATGCVGTSTPVVVTVLPNPTVTITPSGPTTYCAGTTPITLQASGAATYQWNTGATTATISVPNVAGTYTYTVTGTTATGCVAVSASLTVTVRPAPAVTITPSGPLTYCVGATPITLQAGGAATYHWSTGATTASISVPSVAGTYTYTVTGTNATGCASTSAPVVVTVRPLPAATIEALTPTTFCAGGSVTLRANIGTTYLWSNGATTRVNTITLATPGTYTYTVTTTNAATGCSAVSAPVSVTVLPTPTIGLPGSPFTLNSNQTFTLPTTASPAGGTWTWAPTTAGLNLAPNGVITPGSTAGTYDVKGTYVLPGQVSCGRTIEGVVIIRANPCITEADVEAVLSCSVFNDTIVFTSASQLPSAATVLVTCPIKMVGSQFQIPAGSTWYFTANAGITVAGDASLTIVSSTLTAACDDMWAGVVVGADASGFYIGNDAAGLKANLPVIVPYGNTPTASEISHALHGLRVWRPDLVPVRAEYTRWLNNLYSIWLGRENGKTLSTYYRPQGPIANGSAITNCNFDSHGDEFLAPHHRPDALTRIQLHLNDYECPELWLAGNRFAHTLMGICAGEASFNQAGVGNMTNFQATISQNLFEENLLAGIVRLSFVTGPLSITNNHFELAAPTVRPSASWLKAFVLEHPSFNGTRLKTGSAGIFIGTIFDGTGLYFTGNEFGSKTAFTAFPAPDAADGQCGIEVSDPPFVAGSLTVQTNLFRNLAQGINAYNAQLPDMEGNRFENCAVGLTVRNHLWPQCNSFRRTGTVTGRNVGFRVPYGDEPVFMGIIDPFNGSVTYSEVPKNLFVGTPPAGAGNEFIFLLHDVPSGTTPTWRPTYAAYQSINAATTTPNTPTATHYNLLADFQATSPSFNIIPIGSSLVYDDGLACPGNVGFNPNRPVISTQSSYLPIGVWSVEQNNPNPTESNETAIAYMLEGASKAELIVTDPVSGQTLLRKPLDPARNVVQLDVSSLRPGVYVYRVLANGRPVATRRLLIGR